MHVSVNIALETGQENLGKLFTTYQYNHLVDRVAITLDGETRVISRAEVVVHRADQKNVLCGQDSAEGALDDRHVQVSGSTVTWTIPAIATAAVGQALVQLRIFFDDDSKGVLLQFAFTVRKTHAAAGDLEETFMDFPSAAQIVQEESKRVEAEALREQAEAQRQQAEDGRLQAEQERALAETERSDAEAQRQDTAKLMQAAVSKVHVQAETLEPGSQATASGQITEAEGLGILLGIPRGAVGPVGPRGEPGTGLDIKGTFASLEALQAAVANPAQGDMYNVGASAPFTLYMWDQTAGVGQWVEQGQLQGAKGDPGATFLPSVDASGLLSWTNDGGLENPEPRSILGPVGPQGPEGPQGLQGPEGPQGGVGPNRIDGQTLSPLSGLLKANGTSVETAVAGVDFQAPLEAGVDYQAPLTAGEDYQTPLEAGVDYAKASIYISGTLSASGWSGSAAPYTQPVVMSGVTASTRGLLGLPDSATQEERAAARDAMLFVTGKTTNVVTVTADGTLPTVDIPILLCIWG